MSHLTPTPESTTAWRPDVRAGQTWERRSDGKRWEVLRVDDIGEYARALLVLLPRQPAKYMEYDETWLLFLSSFSNRGLTQWGTDTFLSTYPETGGIRGA